MTNPGSVQFVLGHNIHWRFNLALLNLLEAWFPDAVLNIAQREEVSSVGEFRQYIADLPADRYHADRTTVVVNIETTLTRFAEWLEEVCKIPRINATNDVVDRTRKGYAFVYISFQDLLRMVRSAEALQQPVAPAVCFAAEPR